LVARIYDEGKSERSVPLERVKGGSSGEAEEGAGCRGNGQEKVLSPAAWRQWRGFSRSTPLEDEEREGLENEICAACVVGDFPVRRMYYYQD
jgi:hypothetical protein